MKTDTPETDAIIQQVTIETEAGDNLPKYTAMIIQARKLERQRDALLSAMQAILGVLNGHRKPTTGELNRMQQKAQQAIAAVKGEQG